MRKYIKKKMVKERNKMKNEKNKKMPETNIPEPTVRRMPSYLSHLKILKSKGEMYVSAPQIAKNLNLEATQVTKDLSYTKIVGKTRVGYEISELITVLSEFLGFHQIKDAFLVGAGNLGEALIKYEGFKDFGLKIVAAFDINEKIVGKKIVGVDILHLDEFRNLAEKMNVVLGIITTPASEAQSVADLMVGWGIKAIWNFSPTTIKVPEGVIVQNTSIYSNLAVIFNKLNNQFLQQEQTI